MFDGIDETKVLSMTDQQKRWLDNIKRAIYDSDRAMQNGTAEDQSIEQLFKAIDTAKTLRRSLRGDDASGKKNRQRFIEFLGLDIPCARPGSSGFDVTDPATGNLREVTLGEVIYEMRCAMLHENENLNAAETTQHPILLDWSIRSTDYGGTFENGQIRLGGYFLWNRLREVLSKFVTGLDGMIAFAEGRGFSITIRPELGSIRPTRGVSP